MMKSLLKVILVVALLAVMSGQGFATIILDDDFSTDNTDGRWTELANGAASWGFNTGTGVLWGNDFLAQQMSGYTIVAGDVATLTVESTRPSYPYLYDLVAFDGAATYTTIASFGGSLSGSPEDVISGVDISAYAGQELGINVGHGLDWGETDSVLLSVVPEPATMALLGLGGLLLRKRRKA